jgi:hypothetical protein
MDQQHFNIEQKPIPVDYEERGWLELTYLKDYAAAIVAVAESSDGPFVQTFEDADVRQTISVDGDTVELVRQTMDKGMATEETRIKVSETTAFGKYGEAWVPLEPTGSDESFRDIARAGKHFFEAVRRIEHNQQLATNESE